MAYKVINKFYDKDDKSKFYNVGDKYPKGNYKPTKKRIEELSQEHPEFKIAFIQEVKEDSESVGKE